MQEKRRNIFRSKAVDHYIQSREKAVLPRFISPQIFVYLWAVLGLLLIAGGLAWFMQIPVYTSGTALVVPNPEEMGTRLVAFSPPEVLSQIEAGQPLFIGDNNYSQQANSYPIVDIESQVLSPAAIQEQFDIKGDDIVRQPATVTMAKVDRPLGNLEPEAYLGTVYDVQIETGRYRLLTLLPGLGSLRGGN